jgi:hypothetical protein
MAWHTALLTGALHPISLLRQYDEYYDMSAGVFVDPWNRSLHDYATNLSSVND